MNILITGGTKGIGKELVIFFSNHFENVFFFYKNSVDLSKELETKYKNCQGYKVDVSDTISCETTINNIIKKYGSIDVLINNAGILMNKLFINTNINEWKNIIDTNLNSIYNVTKPIIMNMIEKKHGKIINISSISGTKGFSGQTAYSSSKMGIIGFTKSLSKEVGKYNILVNSISPGFIETDILENISEKYKETIIKQIPTRTFGNVNEISNTALMLIKSNYITGSNIIVDGGLI
jgi:3-oxoacyl-[acyl-carrier protein] reductase